MRLQLDSLGKIKNMIHAFQAAILAIAMVLTVAIFTRPGHSDGRVGWYFGLCWLTIPVVIYLVMVPMWSRAQRFANVYAFALLDCGSVFLWLTAWASTASYVASGKGHGSDPKKTGCDNFKYGSPGRCKLSTGVTILGVFLMLAFACTSFFSFRALMTYKRTGMMPLDAASSKYTAQAQNEHEFSAQTQEAFSTNMRHDEFDEYNTDARQGGYAYGQSQHLDEEYAQIYPNEHDDHRDIAHIDATNPISPLDQHGFSHGNNGLDYDTSYSGASGQHSPTISPDGDPRADYGKYGRQSYK